MTKKKEIVVLSNKRTSHFSEKGAAKREAGIIGNMSMNEDRKISMSKQLCKFNRALRVRISIRSLDKASRISDVAINSLFKIFALSQLKS